MSKPPGPPDFSRGASGLGVARVSDFASLLTAAVRAAPPPAKPFAVPTDIHYLHLDPVLVKGVAD